MAEGSPESRPFEDVRQPRCCPRLSAHTTEQAPRRAPRPTPMRAPLSHLLLIAADWCRLDCLESSIVVGTKLAIVNFLRSKKLGSQHSTLKDAYAYTAFGDASVGSRSTASRPSRSGTAFEPSRAPTCSNRLLRELLEAFTGELPRAQKNDFGFALLWQGGAFTGTPPGISAKTMRILICTRTPPTPGNHLRRGASFFSARKLRAF